MIEVRDPAPPTTPMPQHVPEDLIAEIEAFRALCHQRYRFNSIWDNILNVFGICVSLGIVACGVYKRSDYAAILGGLVVAIISAQRAFPFNQRWQFYRTLQSQAANLLTEAKNGVYGLEKTIAALNAMRLDFAQQIPRGSSFRPAGNTDGGKSSAE
ncbi:MAG TPA: hypothetical protein VF283_14745 [Bryobacteraceae bacterium]